MSGTVTVPGSSGNQVVISLNSKGSLSLSQQIAAKLGAFQTLQTDVSTPQNVSPTVTAGQLVLLAPHDTGETINTGLYGYSYVSDQVGGNTLTIAPFTSVIAGGSAGDTIYGGGGDTIAAGGGSALQGNLILEASTPGGVYSIAGGPGNDSIAASGNGTVVDGTGQNLIYVDGSGTANIVSNGQDVIGANTATVNVSLAGSNANLFGDFNAGDPQNTVNVTISGSGSGGSGDTLSAGYSTLTVASDGNVSNDLIFGGFGSSAGSLSVDFSNGPATNDTISAGSSQADVTLVGSQNLVFGDSGAGNAPLTILDNGSNDTISAVNSDATVTAGPLSTHLLVFGGSGGLSFVGDSGAGTATVFGASGGETNVSVAGGLWFTSGSSDATVEGGSGGSTLFGASGQSLTYSGNQGNALYLSLGGNETINASGSSTNDQLVASTLAGANDSIQAGTGTDTVIAGSGADTLGAGGGNASFWFMQQYTTGQHDVITNFTSGTNYANFDGYSESVEQLLQTATAGANTTITLSDNTTVQFLGVTNTQLATLAANHHINSI